MNTGRGPRARPGLTGHMIKPNLMQPVQSPAGRLLGAQLWGPCLGPRPTWTEVPSEARPSSVEQPDGHTQTEGE